MTQNLLLLPRLSVATRQTNAYPHWGPELVARTLLLTFSSKGDYSARSLAEETRHSATWLFG